MTLNEFLSINNQTDLGRKVGVSQAMVSKWYRGEAPVAAEKVLLLSKLSDFKVTPHELRPDIYPHPQDGLPEHMREVA